MRRGPVRRRGRRSLAAAFVALVLGAVLAGVPSPAAADTSDEAALPGLVTNLRVSGTPDSVTVSWAAPQSGGAPTSYKVHLKSTDGSRGKTKTPRAKKTSVTFSNLSPGSTYRVWVRAVNDAGQGLRRYARITLPAPRFDQDSLRALYMSTYWTHQIEYTIGQPQPLSVTLPAATGGTGDLTYSVKRRKGVDWQGAGFSFDPATRVLSSNTGTGAPSAPQWLSIWYTVSDESGTTVRFPTSIKVNAAPALEAVADQDLTVKVPVSISLPRASGGSLALGLAPTGMQYSLSGTVAGLTLDKEQFTLSGTPTTLGSTTLTWTATDLNGATASVTFDVDVSASTAPTAAPTSFAYAQYNVATTVILRWDNVQDATGYVVQVKASAGAFPSTVADSVPYSYVNIVHRGPPQQSIPHAFLYGLPAGDYVARIAAVNDGDAGPWSDEFSFTMQNTLPPFSWTQVG
ncbi:fibronectin type III domain-containing protein [Candidatus Poriferisodalis sp.]|uniref:fibronectin type III domain-containing protein n=1 Tax=Candidatus Poriferisodalis sp. TaxID=3101277 RepID=UPI003B0110E9